MDEFKDFACLRTKRPSTQDGVHGTTRRFLFLFGIGRDQVERFFGLADALAARAVQIEGGNERATDRSAANQQVTVPMKMIGPDMLARVEERNGRSGLGIWKLLTIGFVQVATGPGQIVGIVASFRRGGDDVFDVKSGALQILMHAAVFTAAAGPGLNQPHDFGPG